jgi:hypothetical protein
MSLVMRIEDATLIRAGYEALKRDLQSCEFHLGRRLYLFEYIQAN